MASGLIRPVPERIRPKETAPARGGAEAVIGLPMPDAVRHQLEPVSLKIVPGPVEPLRHSRMGVAISSSSAAPPSIIQLGGAVWVQSPMFNFTVA